MRSNGGEPGASALEVRKASGEVYVYAVHNDHGDLRAWVRDDPRFPVDTAKTVAEWIIEGCSVQRMTWDQAHASMPLLQAERSEAAPKSPTDEEIATEALGCGAIK